VVCVTRRNNDAAVVKKLSCAVIAALVLAATPALARPPMLQVSPGYDARLAESRKAWAEYQRASQQPMPVKRKKKTRR
jgi:hypothetical protein